MLKGITCLKHFVILHFTMQNMSNSFSYFTFAQCKTCSMLNQYYTPQRKCRLFPESEKHDADFTHQVESTNSPKVMKMSTG